MTRSVIRDLYSGRPMARVMSLTFVVFLMIPVCAQFRAAHPLLAPWRYVFIVCGLCRDRLAVALFRLPETLHPEYRLTLSARISPARSAWWLFNRASLCYTLASRSCSAAHCLRRHGAADLWRGISSRELMPSMFALCATSWGSPPSSIPESSSASACAAFLIRRCSSTSPSRARTR